MITKKIFLASSSELKEDREQFELFIHRKNKDWNANGVFLELVQWEDFLDAMSQTRLQDEYNKTIRNCDIFLMLFWTKVGKYTLEEFETAFGQFKTFNKPLIYTYFKKAEIKVDRSKQNDLNSLFAFQDKLESLGHFYTSYKNIDELMLKFTQQLDKLASQFGMHAPPGAGREDLGQRTQAASLIPEFSEKVAALFPLINRDLQENPFMAKDVNIQRDIYNCPIFIIFGPIENLPSVLFDRFALFTLPAHRSFPRRNLDWSEGRSLYFTGSSELMPWKTVPIMRCFDYDQKQDSILYIANELAGKVPPSDFDTHSMSPLVAAIKSLGAAATRNNCSFLAQISVLSRTWDDKRELIISVFEELSSAIRSTAADWLRFLVFIERSADPSGRAARRTFWQLVPFYRRNPAEAIPFGRFPSSLEEPGFWRRLPNLGGVRFADCEKWIEEVARAWNCDVQLAKSWIRDAVDIEDEVTFDKVEWILKKENNVLPQLWLSRKAAGRSNQRAVDDVYRAL